MLNVCVVCYVFDCCHQTDLQSPINLFCFYPILSRLGCQISQGPSPSQQKHDLSSMEEMMRTMSNQVMSVENDLAEYVYDKA